VQTEIEVFPLEEAREALARTKAGEVKGTAVLVP
jgi:D-arabinose 1-dehydrogenase-like Zn-dependent alcohol dehydrogenase